MSNTQSTFSCFACYDDPRGRIACAECGKITADLSYSRDDRGRCEECGGLGD